ncbi:MAG: hypothetical protein ACN6NM_03275 [Acinetobacter bohemicus]
MFHTNSLLTVEQIYNFLKESPDFINNNQFDKLKVFLSELHDHKIGAFEAKKPLKFTINFNKSWLVIDAIAAPIFNNKELFLNWVCIRLNVAS